MVRSPQSSAVPHPCPEWGGCWGGRRATMGAGRAQGGPLGGSQAPGLTLTPLHRRGNGAPREAGMSQGDSQAVHAVGSRHDEVGGDEGGTAEVTSTPL